MSATTEPIGTLETPMKHAQALLAAKPCSLRNRRARS